MTFDTMKMQEKYREAGFDPRQSQALVEGQQESQSELATKADLNAVVSEHAQKTDKAIGDLKVTVAEHAQKTDKAIGDLKVTLEGIRTEMAKSQRQQLVAIIGVIGLAVAIIKLF